jgi:hypothetical protein
VSGKLESGGDGGGAEGGRVEEGVMGEAVDKLVTALDCLALDPGLNL